jgi:hypothetical protein
VLDYRLGCGDVILAEGAVRLLHLAPVLLVRLSSCACLLGLLNAACCSSRNEPGADGATDGADAADRGEPGAADDSANRDAFDDAADSAEGDACRRATCVSARADCGRLPDGWCWENRLPQGLALRDVWGPPSALRFPRFREKVST